MEEQEGETTGEKGLLAFFALAIVPVLVLVALFGRVGDRRISTAPPSQPSVLATSEMAAKTAPTATQPITTQPVTTPLATIAVTTTPSLPTTSVTAAVATTTPSSSTTRAPSTTSRSTVASATKTTASTATNFTVQFASESVALSDAARATLTTVATKIRSLPNGTRVTLTGVADNRGNAATNEKLSRDRAAAVKAALLDLGAKNATYDIVAKGEEVGADLNKARRVDIVIAAP
jgi:outer membrane protein OmpA-like peptidoglycan-associated protein